MPAWCTVMGCNERGSGIKFPKNETLRMKWRLALNRVGPNKDLWKPSEHQVVCHRHFKEDDYIPQLPGMTQKRLKAEVVPSLHLGYARKQDANAAVTAREKRTREREERKLKDLEAKLVPSYDSNVQYEISVGTSIAEQEEIEEMDFDEGKVESWNTEYGTQICMKFDHSGIFRSALVFRLVKFDFCAANAYIAVSKILLYYLYSLSLPYSGILDLWMRLCFYFF